MSGGRSPRGKGNRRERALVRALQQHGFAAERVPLSGAARGHFGGDLSVPLLGADRRIREGGGKFPQGNRADVPGNSEGQGGLVS
jgi:hypothetical protein